MIFWHKQIDKGELIHATPQLGHSETDDDQAWVNKLHLPEDLQIKNFDYVLVDENVRQCQKLQMMESFNQY